MARQLLEAGANKEAADKVGRVWAVERGARRTAHPAFDVTCLRPSPANPKVPAGAPWRGGLCV